MKRFFKSTSKDANSGTNLPISEQIGASAEKKACINVDVDPNEIIADPGHRKPIEEYDLELRDQIRMAYLLKGPYQPFGHYFPRKQQGKICRNFQNVWFKNFDWLEYSKEKDAAFCFYCYLLKQSQLGDKHGHDVFTKEGFTNWKKAIETFNVHVGGVNSNHNNARWHCEDFQNQKQSVSYAYSSHEKLEEASYKVRLNAVLDVVRFLLSQALTFRGHKEFDSSKNRGNFLELLNWYKYKVEDMRRVFDENSPMNSQMTSPSIQKDLVQACAEETTKVIIDEMGDRYFSLLVDESRDSSIKEQMAVIVRFVNKQGKIIERFICLEHIVDTSSMSLKIHLDDLFARHGLSMSRLRGQGYDGASNIRGEFNGLKTLIQNENPNAFYIHRFAHQLQLVVVAVAKSIPVISNFFEYTTMIVNTVGASCKRKDALLQTHYANILERLDRGEIFPGRGKHQETTITRPGDTRWGSHNTTLARLCTMWDSVVEVLQIVHDDAFDGGQRSKAIGLLEKMESFDYVFILHLMMKVLLLTNDLSNALQRKDQNIVNAMGLLESVKFVLQQFRDNGWDALLESVKTFCENAGIKVPNMEDHIPVRGRSKREGQVVTYYHHYCAEVFLVVIDSLTMELNTRFSETSIELLRCIACLDPKDCFAKFDQAKLIRLAEIYTDDFSTYDRMVLTEQLGLFIHNIRASSEISNCNNLSSLAVKMVESAKHEIFPLVYRLIELALILPVATASVERVFSAMNIIKTELRNKIGDKWLNDMMVCYVEREVFVEVDNEKILQRFQNMKPRRQQLPRLLSGDSSGQTMMEA